MSEKKPTDRDHCFRCGKALKKGGIEFDHRAVVSVWNADTSFSGMFRLPLCYSCSMVPHNAGYQRILPR